MDDIISKRTMLGRLPALIWGRETGRAMLHVHGKMSRKEYAMNFARTAQKYGWQTVSFDLPGHGERTDVPCDVWHGMEDVRAAADAARGLWPEVGLFACSLGAYFCLRALNDLSFRTCLFQSPIIDMRWLIEQMMAWNHVTEEQLRLAGQVETPVETLSWAYRENVLANPITRWQAETHILYAGKDNLQPRSAMEDFIRRFGGTLEVSATSEHPFMAPGDERIVRRFAEHWLETREEHA